MLKPAIQYKEDLTKLLTGIWFVDKYKFYIADWHCSIPELKTSTWDKHEFVSVNAKNEIIGMIDYWVDRSANKAVSLCAISFTEQPSLLFGKDLYQAIDDIFCKFNFNKLCFGVVVGNPVEKTYDNLINKYGGSVSGYQTEEVRLFDGQLYDLKTYEIMRRDYLRNKEARK